MIHSRYEVICVDDGSTDGSAQILERLKGEFPRLLAFDICLDSAGNPRLVEVNTGGFSWWMFLYTGQDVFGGETVQVMEYCLERRRTERRHVRVS